MILAYLLTWDTCRLHCQHPVGAVEGKSLCVVEALQLLGDVGLHLTGAWHQIAFVLIN